VGRIQLLLTFVKCNAQLEKSSDSQHLHTLRVGPNVMLLAGAGTGTVAILQKKFGYCMRFATKVCTDKLSQDMHVVSIELCVTPLSHKTLTFFIFMGIEFQKPQVNVNDTERYKTYDNIVISYVLNKNYSNNHATFHAGSKSTNTYNSTTNKCRHSGAAARIKILQLYFLKVCGVR